LPASVRAVGTLVRYVDRRERDALYIDAMTATTQPTVDAGSVALAAPTARFRLSWSNVLLPTLSVAAALALWELISRTNTISQRDLPAMSTSLRALWSLLQTGSFWWAFLDTVRGWALGLGIATVLAVPLGIVLGSSEFAARAFRVPIEFLRPIPSAVLIPLLFLTLGTNLKSEVFLAAFGAFWPLLVQTMYGVRDVDPLALDTGRSFGLGPVERLTRITLPSSVPYIATGLRISSTVALILAFTAELFMGTPGLGQKVNIAQAYGLSDQLFALAIAVGFLGLAVHLVVSALERRALRWHPSQREGLA
jgi:ABC-type nitrate/sulfonate/bicarbonate transport system permease component